MTAAMNASFRVLFTGTPSKDMVAERLLKSATRDKRGSFFGPLNVCRGHRKQSHVLP